MWSVEWSHYLRQHWFLSICSYFGRFWQKLNLHPAVLLTYQNWNLEGHIIRSFGNELKRLWGGWKRFLSSESKVNQRWLSLKIGSRQCKSGNFEGHICRRFWESVEKFVAREETVFWHPNQKWRWLSLKIGSRQCRSCSVWKWERWKFFFNLLTFSNRGLAVLDDICDICDIWHLFNL